MCHWDLNQDNQKKSNPSWFNAYILTQMVRYAKNLSPLSTNM